ncbi:MAG: glycine cleavage system protein GcvH [Anaerolineae bacterium]|nr:glycine cleavage system protein GcvH [Anaerolineae bacterium]
MGDWKTPENAKYTKNDEWILVEGNTAKIGITDYAQDQLSDLVFVDMPETGTMLEKGDTFATVESVKAASDVYTPAGGEIVAVNEALEDNPELINSDPFGEGWIIQIKLGNPDDLDGLLSAAAYAKFCDERDA